jgi:hypothetical protein
MIQIICEAISSHRCLEFTYDGLHRVVEPHVYGETKKGNELIRAYQVAGGSVSGKEPPWRLFSVDEMIGLKASERKFQGTRPLYNPDDPAMADIFCCL